MTFFCVHLFACEQKRNSFSYIDFVEFYPAARFEDALKLCQALDGKGKKEEMSIYLNMDVKKVKTISLHCSIHLSSELRQVAADGCNQNSCPGTAISR